MQDKSGKEPAIFHPFLLALYPPLALLANNISQMRPLESWRAIAVFIIAGELLYLVLQKILKNRQKAGLTASILLIAFASYGQVYDVLKSPDVLGGTLGHNRVLSPIYLILTALAIWGVLRSRGNIRILTGLFNTISIAALLLPLWQIGSYSLASYNSSAKNQALLEKNGIRLTSSGASSPDVYYIILDMYGRDDVLKSRYNFDNSEFLRQLEDMGFYVARCSNSNYNLTELSLASSLNMNTLDQLGTFPAESTDRSAMPALIQHSLVRKLMNGLGYQFVNFSTGYSFLEARDADQFLGPPEDLADTLSLRLNAYESLLIKTTALDIIGDLSAHFRQNLTGEVTINQQHVNREEYLLDELPKLAQTAGSKFVYAHVLIPHPPFVYNADGVDLHYPDSYDLEGRSPTAKEYAQGYRNQLEYIDQRILPVLKAIIANSKQPPVIILQGDHGVDPKRALELNAYYLPGTGAAKLYPQISPVNTFRLVFNEYFGGSFDLLPDTNYSSIGQKPFEFTVTQNSRVCDISSNE
jgi:hypothetical protein